MVVDFDDFYTEKGFDLLKQLKDINPFFKVTLFSIPAKNTPDFFKKVANEDWIELALHGWKHIHLECRDWTAKNVIDYIFLINKEYPNIFVRGFKPPHWTMSREAIDTFLSAGYWLSLHPKSEYYQELLNVGAPIYRFTKESRHGHIDWGGDSLKNNFIYWKNTIKGERVFKFISEVIKW